MSDKLERLKSQLDDLEKKYRERKSKTSLQIKRIEEQARKEKRAFRASSLIKIGLFYLDSEAKRYFDSYINGCKSRNEKPTEMKVPLDYRERRIQRYLNDLGGAEEKHLDLAGKMVDFEIAEIENRIDKLIESYNLRAEQKPIEQKPIEQKPVEQKPVEQKPIEQKPVEQKPIEQKPVEQKPVEQNPIEQKPVEQKPRWPDKPLSKESKRLVTGLDALKADALRYSKMNQMPSSDDW